jgi:hypothetical protein
MAQYDLVIDTTNRLIEDVLQLAIQKIDAHFSKEK